MPGRHIVKIDIADSYYHVYISGRGQQKVFRDSSDYDYFLDLFSRNLSLDQQIGVVGQAYPYLRGQVEVLTYCVLPRHLHLLIYQVDEGAMARLMRSVLTSYTRHFNVKYRSSGPLFASTYKASRISTPQYVVQVSRYIHLSPRDWQAYPYSSIHGWYGIGRPEWLQPERLLGLIPSLPHYADYLDDRSGYRSSIDDISEELADR